MTCHTDIVVVGLDEQGLHVGRPRVALQHADDVLPLSGAGADDADRARRRSGDGIS